MCTLTRREILALAALSSLYWAATGCTSKASLVQQPTLQPNPLDAQSPSQMNNTVLVIGAGIAGLAAASNLKTQGIKVTVIEGRDRIGGRIWTDHSWKDTPIDLGASWINGINGNPVAKFVRGFNIPTVSTDYHAPASIYTMQGKLLNESERAVIETRFRQLMSKVEMEREALNHDIPLGNALFGAIATQNLSIQQQRELRHFINTQIEQDYATDASELSLWYWDEVDEYFGGDVILPGGLDQVVNRLAEGLEIKLDHIVTQIKYNDQGVRVTTNQEVFEAERAIVTLPLGVLQSGSVKFSPSLPNRKKAAIQKLRMGVLNKLWLRFPECFWLKDSEWLEYIGPEIGVWAEFFNFFKYTGKPILVAFNPGKYGKAIEQLSDQAIVAEAMKVLHKMYGTSIPNPDAWQVTRWASDTFTRGSYSYIPPGAKGTDYDILAEPVGKSLFFAGEATQRNHYGTVHGAFLSGVRAARAIIAIAIENNPLLVASKKSRVYHISPDCLDAQNIQPEDRIEGPAASKGRRLHLDCPRIPIQS